MSWATTTVAWAELIRLTLNPPSLFSHLYGRSWYRSALMDAMPLPPHGLRGKSVLDIGCASGDFCGELAAHGALVHGIDRSRRMLKHARSRHRAVRFYVGDAMHLPYGPEEFDVVFAASLLNAVDDPTSMLREMARVCAPGGTVAVVVPAAEFDTTAAKSWVAREGLGPRDAVAYTAWHLLAKKVSASQLHRWVAHAGLEHARIDSFGMLGGLARAVHIYPERRRPR